MLSFAPKPGNYQTECISLETDGYIKIKIWDTKSGRSYTAQQARKDAIHAVLYSGIAGGNGCLTQFALLNNPEAQNKFKDIEKDFFSSNGEWSRFTRSSATETTLPSIFGDKNWKVYQISVSKDALKKYLEQKSILKSINTGF